MATGYWCERCGRDLKREPIGGICGNCTRYGHIQVKEKCCICRVVFGGAINDEQMVQLDGRKYCVSCSQTKLNNDATGTK